MLNGSDFPPPDIPMVKNHGRVGAERKFVIFALARFRLNEINVARARRQYGQGTLKEDPSCVESSVASGKKSWVAWAGKTASSSLAYRSFEIALAASKNSSAFAAYRTARDEYHWQFYSGETKNRLQIERQGDTA